MVFTERKIKSPYCQVPFNSVNSAPAVNSVNSGHQLVVRLFILLLRLDPASV